MLLEPSVSFASTFRDTGVTKLKSAVKTNHLPNPNHFLKLRESKSIQTRDGVDAPEPKNTLTKRSINLNAKNAICKPVDVNNNHTIRDAAFQEPDRNIGEIGVEGATKASFSSRPNVIKNVSLIDTFGRLGKNPKLIPAVKSNFFLPSSTVPDFNDQDSDFPPNSLTTQMPILVNTYFDSAKSRGNNDNCAKSRGNNDNFVRRNLKKSFSNDKMNRYRKKLQQRSESLKEANTFAEGGQAGDQQVVVDEDLVIESVTSASVDTTGRQEGGLGTWGLDPLELSLTALVKKQESSSSELKDQIAQPVRAVTWNTLEKEFNRKDVRGLTLINGKKKGDNVLQKSRKNALSEGLDDNLLEKHAPACSGHRMPAKLLTVNKAGPNKVSSPYKRIPCPSLIRHADDREESSTVAAFQRISAATSSSGRRCVNAYFVLC